MLIDALLLAALLPLMLVVGIAAATLFSGDSFLCVVVAVAASAVIVGLHRYLLGRRIQTLLDDAYRVAGGSKPKPALESKDDLGRIHSILDKLSNVLAAHREEQQALLRNSAETICTLDRALTITTVSESCQSLWGYDSFFLCGRAVASLIVSSDLKTFEQLCADATSGNGLSCTGEIRMQCDDKVVWTLWSVKWSSIEEQFFCVVRDITKQKNLEQLRSDFINMVSHDLRTPLLATQVFLDLINRGAYGQLPAKLTESSEEIGSSVKQLIGLVGDLLDIEKIESGNLDLELCEIPLNELVEQAVKSVVHLANEKQIEILPPQQCDFVVEIDPQRLLQVCQNLLSNAIKFSPPKSEIEIRVTKLESSIRISVIDEGPGVPKEYAEAIFDRFKQVPGSEGTGLGLSICRAIILAHHGEIGCNSELPSGSEFWFTLPVIPHTVSTACEVASHG